MASRENKLTKPELGHLKKHSAPALRNLREFKVPAALVTAFGSALGGGAPRPCIIKSSHFSAQHTYRQR